MYTLVVADLVDLLFDFVVDNPDEDHAYYLVGNLEEVHTLVDIDLLGVQDTREVVRHRTIRGKTHQVPAADLDRYVQRLIPSLDQYHYEIYPIFLTQ